MSGWIKSSLLAVIVASGCTDGVTTSGEDGTLDDDGNDEALQCTSPLPCPAPSSDTKQTLCGQLFDLANSAKLGDSSLGAPCTAVTESGPCSLAIQAYDILAFGSNPTSTAPLAHGGIEIDSCGRYRITDINVTGIGPFIGLAIDDAGERGPAGTTVTTAIATPRIAGTATDNLEAWVVAESTTAQWASSGGPPLSNGVFVPLFRAHMLGTPDIDPFEPQPGVTVTLNGNPLEQYYFEAGALDRTSIDTAAVSTGANGTALIEDASIYNGVVYSGIGGLSDPASCRWHPHVGMSVPGVVFVQIFRPVDVIGAHCPL